MIRVLVCGGRDFYNGALLNSTLSELYRERGGFSVVIVGGARGADSLARTWAYSNDVQAKVYLPAWDKHGRSAGPIRNQWMLWGGKPDLVVAFSGGRGTADMVRRARAAGVEVIEVAGG